MAVLTDKEVTAARPAAKVYKLFDDREPGLSLVVQPNGAKYWWWSYSFAGKRKTLTVGKPYPRTTLAQARERAHELRRLLDSGVDPSADRKQRKRDALTDAQRTFELAANAWYAYRAEAWSVATKAQVRDYLDKDLIATLGRRPLSQITTLELADLIEKIEARGAPDVAKKSRSWLKSIFTFARAKGLTQNRAAEDLTAIRLTHRSQKYPHLSEPELPEMLAKLDATNCSPLVKAATWLSLWTANRPGIIRTVKWSELNLDAGVWTIEQGREEMKRGYSHLTPLPRQAIEMLRSLEPLTGKFEHVFPNRNDPGRAMSDMSVNRLLARIGFKGRQTAHGFRHLISTALNERGYNRDWIERQLAHKDPDKIRGTYNEAHYLEPRREVMQVWADLLDEMRSGAPSAPAADGTAKVVQLRAA